MPEMPLRGSACLGFAGAPAAPPTERGDAAAPRNIADVAVQAAADVAEVGDVEEEVPLPDLATDASLVQVPEFMERYRPGFADELRDVADKQKKLEEYRENHQIAELEKMHPEWSAGKDPCGLLKFTFNRSGATPSQVRAIRQEAEDGKAKSEQNLEASQARIDASMVKVRDEKLDELRQDLEGQREKRLEPVKESSALLEELVSPDPAKRKGRDEVLRASLGEDAVANMGNDVKGRRLKEIRAQRISARTTSGIAAARHLYHEDAWMAKLDATRRHQADVLKETTTVNELEDHGMTAQAKKHEAFAKMAALQQDIQKGNDVIANEEKQKEKDYKEWAKAKKEFEDTMMQLIEKEKILRGAYVRLESRREHIRRNQAAKTECEVALQGVERELPEVQAACDAWEKAANASVWVLATTIETQAKACVNEAMGAASAMAENLMTSSELLQCLRDQSREEKECIEAHSADNLDKIQKLEVQLVSEEPEKPVDEVESDLATLADEQTALRSRLEECTNTTQQLEEADRQCTDSLRALFERVGHIGGNIDQQAARDDAVALVRSVYVRYPLWHRGTSRARAAPPPPGGYPGSSSSGSGMMQLALTSPRFEAEIQRRVKEEVQRALVQRELDAMMRQGPASGLSSEAGDFSIIPSRPPSEAGATAASEAGASS